MKLSILATITITALISSVTLAASNKGQVTKNIVEVKDVETIMDDLDKFSGSVVRVTGEVQDKIDSRSVVLESGGIFNDEIIVVSGPGMKGTGIDSLKENTKVTVTGTVILKPIADIRRDYTWDLNPEMEPEFSDVKAYLVAEEITAAKK